MSETEITAKTFRWLYWYTKNIELLFFYKAFDIWK